ncbi:MAG: MFS transporter [Candidatus Diapherotrites archaeon]|nr:MFS transporter [Candidatus Diapherotrites archaeon]
MDSLEKQKIAGIQKEKGEKVKKSLDASVKDAMAFNVMQGAGINFMNAFAVALKATNFQISMLVSIPQLLSAWIQLLSSELLEIVKDRKKLIGIFVFLQAITWIPILLAPFIFTGLNSSWIVWFVIIFYTMFTVFGAIVGPIWQSLMGDLVPIENRGTYFGMRNAAAGTITLLITLFAGFYLNIFPQSKILYGFAALFFISFLARMISRHFLMKMHDPQFIPNRAAQFTFPQFISKMRSNNFGNFVLYVSCLSLAVNIAAPFFAVYQLRYLHFDYLTFTLIAIAPMISTLFMMQYWGPIADRFGNQKILRVCGLMVSLIPLYWFLFKDPVLIFLCEFFISGFFWAGFNLAAGNFIFDTTTPEKRTRCAAYYNIFNGTGVFIGAMIGGILATIIPNDFLIFKINLLAIFLICFFARIGVWYVFQNRIKEVRLVEEIKDRQMFYNAIVGNPFKGFTVELITTLATRTEKTAHNIAKLPKIIKDEMHEIDNRVEHAIEGVVQTADKIVKRKRKEKPKE